MLLKTLTIFAFTVKLLFAVTVTNAQTHVDSAKQYKIQFYSLADSNKIILNQIPSFNKIPGNFYSRQLPFFCNKELQVQKTVGVPIKFRVGSVDYVDRMEGKNR